MTPQNGQNPSWKKWKLRKKMMIKIIIVTFFLLLILIEGNKQIKSMDIHLTIYLLRSLPITILLKIGLVASLAVLAMTCYDYILVKQFRLHLPIPKIIKYGFIANTFSNFLGFGGFAGASVRTTLYKKHQLPLSEIIYGTVWIAPFIVSGLSIFSWFGIFQIFNTRPLLQEKTYLTFALWGMALYLPLYLFFERSSFLHKRIKQKVNVAPVKMIAETILSSLLEWSLAGVTFTYIVYLLHIHIGLPSLLGIFLLGAIAGMISLTPGGIGTFDFVVLLGFQYYQIAPEKALAVLVIHRMFYYILPFFIGFILFITETFPFFGEDMKYTKRYWKK